MENNIVFLKENCHYTRKELNKLGIKSEYINKMLANGLGNISLLKNKKISFQYVGLATFRELTIVFYPKYINIIWDKNSSVKKTNYLIDKIAKIIKVLKKYKSEFFSNYSDGQLINKSTKNKDYTSDIALADYLLKDYLKNGIYHKRSKEVEKNSSGRISWEDTIAKADPYFINGKPVYADVYNKKKNIDRYNDISLIHKWAVTWSKSKYSKLLGYSNLALGNDFLDDISYIGDSKYLSSILEKELFRSYVDREINLLKVLKELVIRKEYHSQSCNLSLFGTMSFHVVWEKVCSYVFNNQKDEYNLPKPVWRNNQEEKNKKKEITPKKTLVPDIIRTLDKKRVFYLIDAKYYSIKFKNGDIINQPGVSDISKQLLYFKALKEQINRYNQSYNLFVFPKSDLKGFFDIFGDVNMSFIGEKEVKLIYLSDNKVFNYYINNNKLSRAELKRISIRLSND